MRTVVVKKKPKLPLGKSVPPPLIARNLPGNGASMSFTDTNGATTPERFYRIRLQP
jgi:hypothetical protein